MLASVFAYVLFYYRHLGAISTPLRAVLGEPLSAALQRCLLCICKRQGGKPDQLGSSCARVEGNSLRVEIWMRRKCQASSPSTGTAQVKQEACKGVRSLQGPLSTVASCKGCELAALDSLKPPGRSQPEERQRRALSHCSDPPDKHQTNLRWLFSCTAYGVLCGHEENKTKSVGSGVPSCPVFSR